MISSTIRPAAVVVTLLGGVALAVSGGACTSPRDGFEEEKRPSFSDAEAPPPDACAGVRCSPDLKKVLQGCTKEVVATCGPDQGCGGSSCVEACRAAELSKGSSGCSFWTLPPTTDPDLGRGSCFAVMIANTWDRAVTLSAELGPEPLDITRAAYLPHQAGGQTAYERLTGPLPPGQVAIVFLSQMDLPPNTVGFKGCPDGVEPAFIGDPIRHRTALTRAFHLTADAPVTAYSVFPYGGASTFVPTATLLLPVSAWSTNYVAVSTAFIGANARRVLQVVANEDDTEVWISPKANIEDGLDVVGTARGVSKSWRLSRGQTLQLSQPEDLTGSPIEATRPIGLFGGAECANIPADVMACDLTQQQLAPLAQWGSEYALVPYPSRIDRHEGSTPVYERVPYSLVGAVAGTTLSYDPVRPPGAPETLEPGQIAQFMTDDRVVVKSQDASHPFHAAVYMTGETFNSPDGVTLTLGDPEFVSLVPAEQFLDRYVFFADHTYPDTALTIVRRKTARGFLPIELDCTNGPLGEFHPLGSHGEYEYAWVRTTRDSLPQKVANGACGYGRLEAHSEGPFSVTVWGVGRAASYAYAGGAGSRPINDVRAPVVR